MPLDPALIGSLMEITNTGKPRKAKTRIQQDDSQHYELDGFGRMYTKPELIILKSKSGVGAKPGAMTEMAVYSPGNGSILIGPS